MLQLAEFSAWIKVEDVETQEYNIEVSEDGKHVTCWIASELGKRFSVHWSDSRMSTSIGGEIHLDGSPVGGKSGRTVTASKDSIVTSPTTTRPFVFSPLELTDDDSYLNSANAEHIGQIRLEIWRIADKTVKSDAKGITMNEEKVHERTKKGIAHRVKFGEEVHQRSRITVVKTKRLEKCPAATFLFKYRSLEFLRAAGIVAPSQVVEKRKASASPERETKPEVKVEDSDNEEDPDVEEARLLEEKLKAVQSRLAKKGPKRIKTEARSAFLADEVIDLT